MGSVASAHSCDNLMDQIRHDASQKRESPRRSAGLGKRAGESVRLASEDRPTPGVLSSQTSMTETHLSRMPYLSRQALAASPSRPHQPSP